MLIAVGCGGDDEAAPTATQPVGAKPTATTPPSPPDTGINVVEVNNEATCKSGKYQFDPDEFTFKVGETVTFRISAECEYHTFNVDDLNINVDLDADTVKDFEFTFEEAGEFKLICIPHESFGMVGKITVQ